MFGDIFRGSRVLVTGDTGFKGSWLSLWLLDLGAQVSGFSVSVPSNPSHFEVLGLGSRIRHVVGDIRDRHAIDAAITAARPEFVFHLAAQSLVGRGFEDPVGTFETNALGTINVLQALRETNGLRAAVFVTSDKCYENVGWDFGYRENDRLGGADPYSASKACAEIAFSAFARSFHSQGDGVPIASARAGNVIGGGDWARGRLVPDCVRAWMEGAAPIIRHPDATRPWQHVLEPLSGYLWLAACLAQGGGGLRGEAFNFGPTAESDHTVRQLIDAMRMVWPSAAAPDIGEADHARPEPHLLKLSCDKAFRRLGWRQTLSFAETADATARWYRAFQDGKAASTRLSEAQIGEFSARARDRGLPWVQ